MFLISALFIPNVVAFLLNLFFKISKDKKMAYAFSAPTLKVYILTFIIMPFFSPPTGDPMHDVTDDIFQCIFRGLDQSGLVTPLVTLWAKKA